MGRSRRPRQRGVFRVRNPPDALQGVAPFANVCSLVPHRTPCVVHGNHPGARSAGRWVGLGRGGAGCGEHVGCGASGTSGGGTGEVSVWMWPRPVPDGAVWTNPRTRCDAWLPGAWLLPRGAPGCAVCAVIALVSSRMRLWPQRMPCVCTAGRLGAPAGAGPRVGGAGCGGGNGAVGQQTTREAKTSHTGVVGRVCSRVWGCGEPERAAGVGRIAVVVWCLGSAA